MPTAVGDMIVDTNDRDMGASTIQGLAGDDVITCGAGNDTLFGNTYAVLGAAAEESDTAVYLCAPAVYAIIAELHTFGMGVKGAAA